MASKQVRLELVNGVLTVAPVAVTASLPLPTVQAQPIQPQVTAEPKVKARKKVVKLESLKQSVPPVQPVAVQPMVAYPVQQPSEQPVKPRARDIALGDALGWLVAAVVSGCFVSYILVTKLFGG